MERPSTREKRPRSHSAKARLAPVVPPSGNEVSKERVKSAKAIKSQHTSTAAVLARPPSRSFKRFTSMYSNDFDGTFVPPAEIRPTSPTRRNNPHPGKVSKKGVGLNSSMLYAYCPAIYGLEGANKRNWCSPVPRRIGTST